MNGCRDDTTTHHAAEKVDMLRQRGVSLLELIVVGAYLAIVVSAAWYGGKTHGVLGIVVGGFAGAAIPIVVVGLLYYVARYPTRVILGLAFFSFLVLGTYFLRPHVWLLLRLAAVAAVLMVGDFLFQGMYSSITSRGTADGFTLHFGHFLLVIVVGTALAIWWGWLSTAIVLFVDGAWQGLAGLVDRKIIEGLPPGEE
jgi:hypothetical protein